MLQLYKPIKDDIFKLQEILEQLVCDVWCGDNQGDCESVLSADFKPLYKKYKWLKDDVDEIYNLCEGLSPIEKGKMRLSFLELRNIEKICNGEIVPLLCNELPEIVEQKIKPLFVKFYEHLLDRSLVPGDKLQYYNNLIRNNGYTFCPCCGFVSFESADSNYREAFDHYLPKSEYPLASVNFFNLIPLCYKCNSDRKSTRNPVDAGAAAFYPFSNSPENHKIELKIIFSNKEIEDFDDFKREEIDIILKGDNNKCETWDRVFDIKERYNDEIRSFSKSVLRLMKKKYERNKNEMGNKSYLNIIDDEIDDLNDDKYIDRKFLKKAFLEEVKNCVDIIKVYL